MRTRIILPLILLSCFQSIFAQSRPAIPEIDRIRLAEAFRLGETIGNRIWKDWSKAPFAVLLVTPKQEFLIRHPQPSADFTLVGYDPLLKSNVYVRQRTYPTDRLAAMPAIRGSIVSTIVVGEAEQTSAKTSTPWIVTLLHEHFHQLQTSQPDYYRDVDALNLSRGDQTGMWMLNFAFPYDRAEVQEQLSSLSKLLAETLESRGKHERSMKLAAYLLARQRFQQMLSPDDYRYFSFQLWQEGIARYTEYRVAKAAAASYRPGREFRALKDFTPLARVAAMIRERILTQLRTQRLAEAQRTAFYPFGAAEALLLDELKPRWRNNYFADKFDLNRYYKAAR